MPSDDGLPPIGEWFRRVHYLLTQRRRDAELREEMEAHRELMTEPTTFGNKLRLREQSRDVWGWGWLDRVAADARVAARSLGRSRGFTAVATGSLALGLALVTVTLTVTNAYLVRAMPYSGADRIFHVMYAPPGPWEPRNISALHWTRLSDVVAHPITASGATFSLSSDGITQAVRGLRINLGFVQGLGIKPAAGRLFTERDYAADADPVAMIGHALWRDAYGARPDVIGRTLSFELDAATPTREVVRIVGVLPRDFYYGRDSSATVGVVVASARPAQTYMIRLRYGVPREMAEHRLTEAVRAISPGLPADWTGVRLEGVRNRYVAEFRPLLVGVTIAAGLVLLLVSVNVAVLALLRAMRRQKEMAVRTALGAGRVQLIRLLGFESAIVCALALATGLLLSQLAVGVLGPAIEARLGRPAPGGTSALSLDAPVLAILGAVSAAIALSFSLLPLLTPWRRRVGNLLGRTRADATDGFGMRRLRSTLIALEVAGTLVLVSAGAVMIRGITGLLGTDLGFEAERLVKARVVLRSSDYGSPDAFYRFFDRYAESLAATTRRGVVFANWPPFVERPVQVVEADGQAGRSVDAGAISVGGGYFATLGTALIIGRDFTSHDARTDAPVAVISETLAAHLWPGAGAISHQIRVVRPTPDGPRAGPWRTVVGVARDVRQEYHDAELADVYTPISPAESGRFGTFYVRTERPAPEVAATLRRVAAEIDSAAVVDNVRQVTSDNTHLEGARFLTRTMTIVSVIALVLAVVGMYGVVAYNVRQREREIAIRMAVGATAASIRRLFMRETIVVLAAGLAMGLVGAVAATRLLGSRIYGLPGTDVSSIAVGCALLAAATALAGWWPARRAAMASPVAALKEE